MSTATRPTSKHPRNSQFASVWLEFLGSMNLAITLLVAIAVASVVGAVLQQNQAYQDYVIKFGPFWFAVFDRPGLFNVYGAGWFMLILTFLVVSTSVCIYRTRGTASVTGSLPSATRMTGGGGAFQASAYSARCQRWSAVLYKQ